MGVLDFLQRTVETLDKINNVLDDFNNATGLNDEKQREMVDYKEIKKNVRNVEKAVPTARLFDKDDGEIRSFTPNDFNRERPKR